MALYKLATKPIHIGRTTNLNFGTFTPVILYLGVKHRHTEPDQRIQD